MNRHRVHKQQALRDGIQRLYRFDNNYGASVIKCTGSYGKEYDLWELGVIKWTGIDSYALTTDTPITSDVIGNLNDRQVEKLLDNIKSLPQEVK
jgi:hypothetical protein